MTSILTQIADAMVEAITAETWPVDFRTQRTYADLDTPSEQLDAPIVDVVMPDAYDEHRLDSNGTEAREVTYAVAFRKRFDRDEIDATVGGINQESLDKCLEVSERLSLLFTALDLSVNCNWIATEGELYRRDDLRDRSQFTAVWLVTFEINTIIGA